MPTIIKPTIGRVVWFTPAENDENISKSYSAPFAAHVCYVLSDDCVNLMVISPEGLPLAYTSVSLIQDGDSRPELGRFCEWMPYQKGQAAKVEAAPQADALPRAEGSRQGPSGC